MSFVDSHCHLDFAVFDADRDEVLARAEKAGVTRLVIAATEPKAWEKMARLRDAHPAIDASVGIHPQWIERLAGAELDEGLLRLQEHARSLKARAIGEFGFDGNVAKDGVSLEEQARVADAHIQTANALKLPVILHIYRAHEFALRYLEEKGSFAYGGVVHSYSGAREFVNRYVALNLHLSFAGAVTRPNAARPLEALRAVPRDRLLLESDAPDQTPHGAPRDRNEPAELLRTAEVVAKTLELSLDELARVTTENAKALFG